jgi:anion-transporting  ArsA/GET3 family ATPase
VGKTTVASALALVAAERGKKVLLCELDAKGDLISALRGVGTRNAEALSFKPRELHPRLHCMVMDPEESLKEYLRLNLRIPLVTRIGMLSTVFDFLANAAPGVREIVTIGKLAYEGRERNYDLVVVDATASGHVIGLLRAPQAINELVGVGLIQSQTRWILDILGDEARTAFVVATTPEEMPVIETLSLLERARAETSVAIGAVVANRVAPTSFTVADRKAFDKIVRAQTDGRVDERVAAWATATGSTESSVNDVVAQVALAESVREARAEFLAMLLAGVGATPTAIVPQLFDEQPGIETTRAVAAHLVDELSL